MQLPTFSGSEPTEKEYLAAAKDFLAKAKAGDCKGARALADSEFNAGTDDLMLCSSERASDIGRVDLNQYKITTYGTAGAFVDFVKHGFTVSVGMKLQGNSIVVSGFYVF